jgi:hypothetical protein
VKSLRGAFTDFKPVDGLRCVSIYSYSCFLQYNINLIIYSEYLGAAFEPEADATPRCKSQMRPDTPKPDTISVEEMETQLLETACQNSLCSHMEELAAQELAQSMDIDKNQSEGSQIMISRSPSPLLAEYNEHGVLTTRSKGKGHTQ